MPKGTYAKNSYRLYCISKCILYCACFHLGLRPESLLRSASTILFLTFFIYFAKRITLFSFFIYFFSFLFYLLLFFYFIFYPSFFSPFFSLFSFFTPLKFNRLRVSYSRDTLYKGKRKVISFLKGPSLINIS